MIIKDHVQQVMQSEPLITSSCYDNSPVHSSINCVDVKAGNVVHLQKPGLEVFVNEDVKAKQFEASVSSSASSPQLTVNLGQNLISAGQHCLYTNILIENIQFLVGHLANMS